MTVSAKEVQELRKMSGAGMMECKSALSDSGGDISQAFKLLREKGIAKAEKKSGRDANEGLIGVRVQAEKATIIEVNSETDFVSRNSEFHSLVNSILDISMDHESNLANNEKVYESTIKIRGIGYVMGAGPNQKGPQVAINENFVEVRFPREHVMLCDINEFSDEGYRP